MGYDVSVKYIEYLLPKKFIKYIMPKKTHRGNTMICEFTIVPLDKGESLSEYVAKIIDLVDKSGLDYCLTPMGTIVEGDWDEIMALIKECHHHMRRHSQRVSTSIKIDDREGAKKRIDGKIESVEKRLGRPVKK